jgi:hypothetical protein
VVLRWSMRQRLTIRLVMYNKQDPSRSASSLVFLEEQVYYFFLKEQVHTSEWDRPLSVNPHESIGPSRNVCLSSPWGTGEPRSVICMQRCPFWFLEMERNASPILHGSPFIPLLWFIFFLFLNLVIPPFCFPTDFYSLSSRCAARVRKISTLYFTGEQWGWLINKARIHSDKEEVAR